MGVLKCAGARCCQERFQGIVHTSAQPVPGTSDPSRLQSYDKLLHAAQACIKSCIRPVRLPTLCTQAQSILKGLCSHLARRPGGPGKLLLCSCSTLFPAWAVCFSLGCVTVCVTPSLQLVRNLNPCSCSSLLCVWYRSKPCSVHRASMWSHRCCAQQQLARCSSWTPWRRTMRCGELPCRLCFGWHNYALLTL